MIKRVADDVFNDAFTEPYKFCRHGAVEWNHTLWSSAGTREDVAPYAAPAEDDPAAPADEDVDMGAQLPVEPHGEDHHDELDQLPEPDTVIDEPPAEVDQERQSWSKRWRRREDGSWACAWKKRKGVN